MNSLARQAKFFCESCGAEVPHNSKVCNNCGRFFASVRCPNCGKTGTSSSFINGCPQCGYAVSGSKGKNYKYKNKKSKKGFSLFSNNSKISRYSNSKNYNYKTSSESGLPLWIYILVVSVFIVLICCLYNCMI